MSFSSTAWYLVAFVVTALAPGFVLARLCLPDARTWMGMAGQAFGVGIPFTLLGWFFSVLTDWGGAAWMLSVVVCALSLMLSTWRAKLSFTPEARINPLSALALVAAAAVQLKSFMAQLNMSQLLPAGSFWYQDNLWHLGINGLLKNRLIPTFPQVLGEPLNYHWLANAHMAGMELATGLPNDMVLLRLWFFPMIVGAGLIAVPLVEMCTRRVYLAPYAGAIVLLAPSLRLDNWMGMSQYSAWVPNSPSQTLAIPFLLMTVYLAVLMIIRFRRTSMPVAFWVLAIAVFLLAPGAKSSHLPVIAAGALFALVASLKIAGLRPYRFGLGAVLALSIAAVGATSFLFAGSGAGTGLQIGSTIRRMAPWSFVTGVDPYISSGLLLPGVTGISRLFLLGGILVIFLVNFAWIAPGVAAMAAPRLAKNDPSRDESSAREKSSLFIGEEARQVVLWFMLGLGLGGFAACMVVDHDGMSQVYFLYGAMAILACFAIIGTDVALSQIKSSRLPQERGDGLERISPRWLLTVTIAAGVAGGLLLFNVRPIFRKPSEKWLVGPLVTLEIGVFVLMAVGIWALAYLFTTSKAGNRAVKACAMISLLIAGTVSTVPALWGAPPGRQGIVIPQSSVQAATWIRDHTSPDTVIATNSHCLSGKTAPNCDARSFWVSGMSERQTFIEGWAYTAAAHKAHGVDRRSYSRQPFSDPQAYEMNERAIGSADPDAIKYLQDRGVTYLFAVTSVSPVSSALNQEADLVYQTKTVRIYRLKSPEINKD